MRRPGQVAVVAVFCIFITAPLVLYVLGVRPGLDENRPPASFPAPGAADLVDDQTYAQIGSAYSDRLPFRDRIISLYVNLQDRSTITGPFRQGIPQGSDGWLYFPDTLREGCVASPEGFIEAGRAAFEATRKAGVPFSFFVAPVKVSVYPEHAPAEGLAGLLGLDVPKRAACTALWEEAIDRAATREPWLHPLVDQVRARSTDPNERTFFKLDTHWTDHGALAQTVEVLDSVAPGMWDPREVVRTEDVRKVGDLTLLRGRPTEEVVPGYAVVRPGVTVTREPESTGDVTDDTLPFVVTRATSTEAPLVEGTTLFIGDSFGLRSLHLLSPYFEELVFVNQGHLLRHRIGSLVQERPDRIIVEQVQRNLHLAGSGLDAAATAARFRG